MSAKLAGFYVDPFALSMVRLRSIPGHPDRFTVIGCSDGGLGGPRVWKGKLYCMESNSERPKVELETDVLPPSKPTRIKGSWMKPQRMISFDNGTRWKRLVCAQSQLC